MNETEEESPRAIPRDEKPATKTEEEEPPAAKERRNPTGGMDDGRAGGELSP